MTGTKKQGRFKWVVILVLVVILILVIGYYLLASQKELPTLPEVSISSPYQQSILIVDDPVVVRGSSIDPEGVASIEFWVNGELIGKQINPDPQPEEIFSASQSFRPVEEGPYTIFIRAEDAAGYPNESIPLVVDAQSYDPPEVADIEVFADAADTLASIAEEYGVDLDELSELNPGGAVPGGSVTVRVPAGQAAPDGEEEESDPAPAVGQPQPGQSPGGGGLVLTPISLPGWANLIPAPGDPSLLCKLAPAICNLRAPNANAPDAPSAPHVSIEPSSCKVTVSWLDTNEDENGFRVYRQDILSGSQVLVEELTNLSGTGQIALYHDAPVDTGRYRYLVSAFNSGGESFSGASISMEVECPLSLGDAAAVGIGMAEMTTVQQYDRLYCYLSFMGEPYQRFPASQSEFLIPGDEVIDLVDFFGVDGSRSLLLSSAESLFFEGECLGWQGSELSNLGSFSRSHPPEDWNGQLYTTGPDSGAFTITYRLNGLESNQVLSGHLESFLIPVPTNLRVSEFRHECSDTTGCRSIVEPSLMWDYDTAIELPEGQSLAGFRVHRRLPSEIRDRVFVEKIPFMEEYLPIVNNTAPLMGNCDVPASYYVTTVSRGVYGEVESPPSEVFHYNTPCQIALEITMETLKTGNLKDGLFNNKLETYGFFSFIMNSGESEEHGVTVEWNGHPNWPGSLSGVKEPNLWISPPPYTSSLEEDKTYHWEDFWLGVDEYEMGDGIYYSNRNPEAVFGKGQNTIIVPFRNDFEHFSLWILVKEDDGKNGDDTWCDIDDLYSSRSPEEWLSFDETISYSCDDDHGEGTITLKIRGLEYDGGE